MSWGRRDGRDRGLLTQLAEEEGVLWDLLGLMPGSLEGCLKSV